MTLAQESAVGQPNTTETAKYRVRLAAHALELRAAQALRFEVFTLPVEEFACPLDSTSAAVGRVPRLMSPYISMGAVVCGPPAIDREFRSIDFLTWVDIEAPPAAAKKRQQRFNTR